MVGRIGCVNSRRFTPAGSGRFSASVADAPGGKDGVPSLNGGSIQPGAATLDGAISEAVLIFPTGMTVRSLLRRPRPRPIATLLLLFLSLSLSLLGVEYLILFLFFGFDLQKPSVDRVTNNNH